MMFRERRYPLYYLADPRDVVGVEKKENRGWGRGEGRTNRERNE